MVNPKRLSNILLVLLCIGIFNINCLAQQKLPDIQALCKIELKDGNVVEGYISLGYAYDKHHYHPNAFYITTTATKTIIPIHLGFEGFYWENFQNLNGIVVYYAESKSNNPQFLYKTEEVNGQTILNKKTLREEEYKLKETFSIYKSLPVSMKLRAKNLPEEQTELINVNDIKTFELMKAPNVEWLSKINSSKERLTKKMASDKAKNNPWLGFEEALWYHELIHNKQALSKWKKYFE